ncbi:hypothetical protein MMC25_001556 [Agyrium rufum]|nr:hypothetical protein [Agyrium rufum]
MEIRSKAAKKRDSIGRESLGALEKERAETQSALTDYLASNNISAAQIRSDYERRRQATEAEVGPSTTNANIENEAPAPEGDGEDDDEGVQATLAEQKKRKRKEAKAIEKIKQSKKYQKRKHGAEEEPDGDDDEIAWDMYQKSKPMPGQLENCEICDKRFTVTAYSKTGPNGGLLCTKCSKEFEAERKKDAKAKKKPVSRARQRQVQSNLLDGIVGSGSKSLQELCIEKVAAHINDVDEFGDLPPKLLDRLSQILSKRRVVDGRTLDLFLQPDLDTVTVYDCGKLEVADFIRIFSIVPKVEKLNLRHAGQVKDEVIDYIMERDVPLKHLQLDASNLVSDEKWREFFTNQGARLESLKISWLDNAMTDETIGYLVRGCPNLRRLKMRKCFKVTDETLEELAKLQHLEHLTLEFVLPTTVEPLNKLIASLGPKLRTLSLERFVSADDTTLQAIHDSCRNLQKFRFTLNDYCTDAAFAALFTNWANPPLTFADLSSNRDVDYTQPEGPDDDPVGLGSASFSALIHHSGSRLETLDIASCRHISYDTLSSTFDGQKTYPCLKDINLSFCPKADTAIVVGIFRSCPALKKLTAFACVNVKDAVVPPGVALVGVPNAQDSIIQEGGFSMGAWNAALAMAMEEGVA